MLIYKTMRKTMTGKSTGKSGADRATTFQDF